VILLAASILYLIATILGVWSASLLWRAWHSWRLQRRAARKEQAPSTVITPGRRRFGVAVALVALPSAGLAYSFGRVVHGGDSDSDTALATIVTRAAVAMLLFMAMGAAYVAVRFDPSNGRRRCGRCWYDMSATAGLKCPECGTEAPNERALFRTRRAPRLAAGVVVLLAMAYAASITSSVVRNGPVAAVPTTAMIVGLPWLPDWMVIGADGTLADRCWNKELTGWQRWLLSRRCRGVIEGSADIDSVGRAGELLNPFAGEPLWGVAMGPLGQHEFFQEMEAEILGTRTKTRVSIAFLTTFLPGEIDPTALEAAESAVRKALESPLPQHTILGLSVAPRLGARAETLVPVIEAIAEDPSVLSHVVQTAHWTLAAVAERNPAAREALLRGFDHPDPEVRRVAIWSTMRLAQQDSAVRARVMDALADKEDAVAVTAAHVLLQTRQPACDWVPRLGSLLRARPWVVGENILQLASACPCSEIVEGVRVLLRFPDADVQTSATKVVPALGDLAESLLPDLKRMLEQHEMGYPHDAAAEAIRWIEELKAERGGSGE
jgi:hypothetical protein